MNSPDTTPTEALAPRDPVRVDAISPVSIGWPRAAPWVLVALGSLAVAGLAVGWSAQMRLRALEPELVRRQQESHEQATEARLLARQSQDASVEAVSKLALLDAKVAESALQRSQVEELISSLSRSRDENVLADVEAALRVAQQQSAITGSAEPLVAVLRQSEERLARYNQPRLERVRRAVARDLDLVRAAAVVDLPSLSIRIDEVVRLVDELPLISAPGRRAASPVAAQPAAKPAAAASAAASGAVAASDWQAQALQTWRELASQVWTEVRTLVRVTEIERPEAMLITPEQGFFLRENLKLRLLNARLALMSRQFDLAQTDLRMADQALDRYFDRNSRRVVAAADLVRTVMGQSRAVTLPGPDNTLAALAAAAAGR